MLYARSLVPRLPYGLSTISAKKKIINSTEPTTGAVAVQDIYGDTGHVSVVTDVRWYKRVGGWQLSVTIKEANYRPCRITVRRGSPASLGIVGFFKP